MAPPDTRICFLSSAAGDPLSLLPLCSTDDPRPEGRLQQGSQADSLQAFGGRKIETCKLGGSVHEANAADVICLFTCGELPLCMPSQVISTIHWIVASLCC